MKRMLLKTFTIIFLSSTLCFNIAKAESKKNQINISLSSIERQAIYRNKSRLDFYIKDKGVNLGANAYLRAFIKENRLELWLKKNNGKFQFIRNYRLCNISKNAHILPSTGIYYISKSSFKFNNENITLKSSFPNAYDIAKRTEFTSLNIAADCNENFGLGLTYPEMEELFTIIYFATKNGQKAINLSLMPFEMNNFNMFTARNNRNYGKYKQLAPIYDYFENNHKLPNVSISKNGYKIN